MPLLTGKWFPAEAESERFEGGILIELSSARGLKSSSISSSRSPSNFVPTEGAEIPPWLCLKGEKKKRNQRWSAIF